MYICISLFFITLTLTTLGSFYVGLKFWGILDNDKPVEETPAELYWNQLSEPEKEMFMETFQAEEQVLVEKEELPW
jgi:hypothetical protein